MSSLPALAPVPLDVPDATPEAVELSIVMPCLNEAETVVSCVTKARRYLESRGISGEVIVADNGSTDGSQELATRAGGVVVSVDRKGYGSALLGGIAAARGRYIVMGDADGSYDFGNLDAFLAKLRDGYQLVMGNRFRGGIAPGAMPPLHRYFGNPVLTAIGRLLFWSPPCGDFHCGLRGFSKEAVSRMDLRTTGMEFASELVVKATLFKMRIAEVPTRLEKDGRTRAPHLRSWHDGWRHLRFLLVFSPRWVFFYPGLLLIVVGTLVGTWLLPGPRTVAGVTLDLNTLLYSALAVLIGFQAVTFATFTKVFAVTEGLLPEDRRLVKVHRYATLESGLIAGAVLIIAGLIGSVVAVGSWGATHFGDLDPRQSLRMVIPAFVALSVGCQVVLSSFFLSVLRLQRRTP